MIAVVHLRVLRARAQQLSGRKYRKPIYLSILVQLNVYIVLPTCMMTMKMLGEELQIRFELKSDNTFTAVPYENGEKKDEDPISGTWGVEGDDIVLTGKDDKGEEAGFKFNKDTLKLSAMTKDGKDGLDMLKALMGEEALTLKKL